ncbi:MAG TPA: type II secretion system F family protein [Frankiaceae bacterium]|jgi:tight adherence protein C|nr:type II secretion system F family protein [Frankiaceae bacterium]
MIGAGALLGLVGGLGAVLTVLRLPILRRVRMADRVAAPAVVMGIGRSGPAARRSLLQAAAVRLDRIVGGRAALSRRLDACGGVLSVEQYRASQVLWAASGALPGAALLALGGLSSRPSVSLAGAALVIAGLAGGVAARDARLSQAIKERDAAMLAELPAVADLFALAVAAGESPLGALHRVARGGGGPLRDELRRVLADVRAGTPLIAALDAFAARTSVTALARFLDGLVVAVERGTPLADLLRAQASDVRESAKRQLMEAGGRKEIAMMIPVVFLVLPTVVAFAAYPAFTSLSFVTH